MKRVLNLVVAALLVSGLGVGAAQPAQAAGVATSNSVTAPNGTSVQKLPTLPGSKLSNTNHVSKGKPSKPGTITTLATCDGVTGPACFSYNIGSQGSISKNGVTANVRIGGHTGALDPTTGYHTLGEIAAESADTKQIVEVGWTVDPAINKTAGVGVYTPRPFVFSWVNGVGGVYNGGAFVPVSGATVVPGTTNLTPGDVVQMAIWHDDTVGAGAWWIQWAGSWLGYYPDATWTGATPSVTFNRMEYVQLFGEIAATKSKPCSDMGLGVLPTDTTNSTRFSSTSFINTSVTSLDSTSVNLFVRPSPTVNAGSPYAGTAGAGSPPSTTNLRSFYYGGPMWNSAGTAAGTKGSC